MNTSANGAPTLSNYQLRLPAYEGPLDVLLRLIERSQLAIEDVSLVAVTDQFLEFVATMEGAAPTVIADFASVGARLTVLKSRSLLPRTALDTEEPEQSDLTHQLREYKRVKELAAFLARVNATGGQSHPRATSGAILRPEMAKASKLVKHDAKLLARAIRRRLTTVPRPTQMIRQRRVVSLRDLVDRLADMVATLRSVQFSDAASEYRTRTDVATAFLAVLVLVRRGQLEASQDDLFADISLIQSSTIESQSADLDDEFLN